MKLTDNITITNEDNMQLMARYPDNYFELAIVDPPYGIDVTKIRITCNQQSFDSTTIVRTAAIRSRSRKLAALMTP